MATPIAEGPDYRPAGYRRTDRVMARDYGIVFRILASVAASVLLVFGLIALVRVSWDDGGLDAEAVDVADMTFTPVVAIGTTAVGLIALIAAATRGVTSKIVVGALLVAVGIVTFVTTPDTDDIVLEDAHGWLAVIVGGILLLAALGLTWRATRVVETDAVYDEPVA
jgi:hypothetical protein